MPRRIVIHAGFHKTGTSTVQQFLRKNRTALMPVLAIRLKRQMTGLLHAARGYSTRRDPLTLAKVAHRFDSLLADLPGMPRRTLVLSGEELSGHMPGRRDVVDYGAAPELAQVYGEIIAARFPQADVHFFFTTRMRASWLDSAYWEHVKSSSMTLDIATFCDRFAAGADLHAATKAVRAAVPHAVHSADIASGDTITPLLDLCAVPMDMRPALFMPAAANVRLPQDVLLELLAANRAYPTQAARRTAKQDILARLQAK